MLGDALAGQVHDCVDTFQRVGIDRSRLRIERDVVALRDAAAFESQHAVTLGCESIRQRAPDEPTGTTDHDVHDCNVSTSEANEACPSKMSNFERP